MPITPRTSGTHEVGDLLRQWRQQRRLSQLALALRAGISARHLSFLESGRAAPSRDMVLRLAEWMDLPLRARNEFLLAAGYAPAFPDRLASSGDGEATRVLIERVLAGHEPHPAVAIDRHWNVVAANQAAMPMLTCVGTALQHAPMNVLRNSLHADGLSSRILNYGEWRAHLLARLSRQVQLTGDPVLTALLAEVSAYPSPTRARCTVEATSSTDLAVPLVFNSPVGTLRLLSTTLIFGTATEVTLSEVAVEIFYPMDDVTTARLRELAECRHRA